MNLLTHLFFSHHAPAATVGSLLGDFVKGRPDPRYSPTVREAITLHRAIDGYTDRHPIVGRSKRLISPTRRRYAGILVDIFYDYYLCHHWQCYSAISLDEFIRDMYNHMQDYDGYLPTKIRDVFQRMVQADWLSAYRSTKGIALTIERVAHRIPRRHPLSGAIEELHSHRRALDDHFQAFFPELIAFCTQMTSALSG